MGPYWIVMAAGALLSFGLYARRLKQRGLSPALSLWGLGLGAALAAAGAKAGYVLLKIWQKGLAPTLAFSYDKLSVVCGAAALCGGIALTARIARPRAKALSLLDAFAPCGALLMAFVRAGEYFLDIWGAGKTVLDDGEAWARPPFFIRKEYEGGFAEWFSAVCMLSALLALAIAVVYLLYRGKRQRPSGWVFERVAMLLALCQIFCESLRNDCISWGFVRADQVLCAVVAAALVLRGCLKSRRDMPGWKRFLPLIVAELCIAVIVGMEFSLDKGMLWLTNKLIRVPQAVDRPHIAHNAEMSYGIMILCLAVMFWMQGITLRRREQA